ncbi:hypothetical protein IWQ62_003718 [Dispira parvispora]|uniref:Uncharacterized protein n=1 Tax=Dispira parvispora TaxID=1520584 RepID=A0A9W8AQD0_9FUNG|nr:hypothetical protein IWQ62_003718 [Dispira parvispora]
MSAEQPANDPDRWITSYQAEYTWKMPRPSHTATSRPHISTPPIALPSPGAQLTSHVHYNICSRPVSGTADMTCQVCPTANDQPGTAPTTGPLDHDKPSSKPPRRPIVKKKSRPKHRRLRPVIIIKGTTSEGKTPSDTEPNAQSAHQDATGTESTQDEHPRGSSAVGILGTNSYQGEPLTSGTKYMPSAYPGPTSTFAHMRQYIDRNDEVIHKNQYLLRDLEKRLGNHVQRLKTITAATGDAPTKQSKPSTPPVTSRTGGSNSMEVDAVQRVHTLTEEIKQSLRVLKYAISPPP